MNTNPSNENDPALRATLKEWKLTSPVPPRFQEQVWKLIERAEATTVSPGLVWASLTDWIATMLPRPALAVAYVTVLLAVGATVGWTQGRQETSRFGDELSVRYVRAVDPYQAVR